MRNVPIPFRESTLLTWFDLAEPGTAEIAVYDVGGQLAHSLVRGPHRPMRHALRWDGLDDGWNRVPGGLYFVRLSTERLRESRRIVRLR